MQQNTLSMSRLSQSIAFLNITPKGLTKDWIKTNLTDIEITLNLKQLRKEHLKTKQVSKN